MSHRDEGPPQTLVIRSSWPLPLRPGNMVLRDMSSPMMQPIDQLSICKQALLAYSCSRGSQ